MIDVITGKDRHRRPDDVREMYRQRHRVFKERLGWQVPSIDGLEYDDFDHDDTLYLMCFDDAERQIGSARMLPTSMPYMLKDVFPQLLDGEKAPENAFVWEGSRLAVDIPEDPTSYEGRKSLAALGKPISELFLGVVETCLANGVEEFITVYDLRVARLYHRLGCRPHWRSERHQIGETVAFAARFAINADVLEDIRHATGIADSVIRSAPWKENTHVA